MIRRTGWKAILIVAPLWLAGCGVSTTVNADGGSFSIDNGKVVFNTKGAPRAEISADGSFTIDGKPVALDDAQRANLVKYHAQAMRFIEHAKDTGAAGAAVGVAAVKEVASGLASGDTSKVGERVEAKADIVRQAADKLCTDLDEISTLQKEIGAQLAAFKPYGIVGDRDPAQCHKDVAKGGVKNAEVAAPAAEPAPAKAP